MPATRALTGSAKYFIILKHTAMADNPNKKKADGKRVSKQTHEQAYQKRKSSSAQGKKQGSKGKAGA
jgi:hypothetical protein